MASSSHVGITSLFEQLNLKETVVHDLEILRHKSFPTAEIKKAILKKCDIETSLEVEDATEKHHSMQLCRWTGQSSQPTIKIITDLCFSSEGQEALPIWIAHPSTSSNDEGVMMPKLHQSMFKLKITRCALGAFSGPTVFCDHASWNAGTVHFDFHRDVMQIHLGSQQYQLESNFDQLCTALVIDLKKTSTLKKKSSIVSLYFFIDSVPKLSKQYVAKSGKIFYNRVTELDNASSTTIGLCSVLMVSLSETNTDEVFTLFEKLQASKFKIWWSNIQSEFHGPKEQCQKVAAFLSERTTTLTEKCVLSEGFKVIDQLSAKQLKMIIENGNVHRIVAEIRNQCIVDMHEILATEFRPVPFPNLPGYARIPKVIITPTRVIYSPPEMVKMNRVIREFGPDNFLTVSIREEDGSRMATVFPRSLDLPITRLKSILSEGIECDGRTYMFLGSSNSQLRSHGCWMYTQNVKDPHTVEDIRQWMGDLSGIRCVAVYMSRLGQFFSSAAHTMDLSGEEFTITEVPDIERNGYCFTDGAGSMSEDVSYMASKILKLDSRPSAYQIRLAGCKGVLTVDPKLQKGSVVIHTSMKKFSSNHRQLEFMDVSKPHPLSLNRQVITILSQLGIDDRVFLKLQEEVFHRLSAIFHSNQAAIHELSKAGLNIDVSQLHQAGIDLTIDPFFRNMLLVIYQKQMNELVRKTKIPLSIDKGRLMMGVFDQTGLLKSGQVFVQYSRTLYSSRECVIHTGKIVITKNPCFHPGDVRNFEAIDIPDLHHIKDCIVFPVNGDRPHPDEMSGSDLDGDMYWVTWHPDLIRPHENYRPMEFPKPKILKLHREPENEDLINFFGEYVKHDRLGTIANAHLVQADSQEKGIFSNMCLKLAAIHSLAVDFSKSGEFPDLEPQLRPKYYPDFMMKKDQNQYTSERVLGKLFRNASQMEESLKLHLDSIKQSPILVAKQNVQLEQLLEKVPVTDCLLKKATIDYNLYANQMQQLLDTYGYDNEYDLISGTNHSEQRRGVHRSDHFETIMIIKSQLSELWTSMKRAFKSQEGWPCLFSKAMAWYRVAYQDGKFRSFAWMASNQIAVFAKPSGITLPPISLYANLDENMNNFESQNMKDSEMKFVVIQKFVNVLQSSLPDSIGDKLKDAEINSWLQGRHVYLEVSVSHSDEKACENERRKIMTTLLNLEKESPLGFTFSKSSIVECTVESTVHYMGLKWTVHICFNDSQMKEHIDRINCCVEDRQECLKLFILWWMLDVKLTRISCISPLHMCLMVMKCLEQEATGDKQGTSTDLLACFRYYTQSENLEQFFTGKWEISEQTLQIIHLAITQAFHLVTISGDWNVLFGILTGEERRYRKTRILSSDVAALLADTPGIIERTLSVRSGCSIEIKQVPHRKTCLQAIEAFGSQRALKKLDEHVQHFENVACELKDFSALAYTRKSQLIIFEGSKSDEDEITYVPYEGKSYKRTKRNLHMHFLRPMLIRRKESKVFDMDSQLSQWNVCLETLADKHDPELVGDLRLIARFDAFHFVTSVGPGHRLSIKQFTKQLTKGKGFNSSSRHGFPMRQDITDTQSMLVTSTMPRNIADPADLVEYLLQNSFVPVCHGIHRIICTTIMEDPYTDALTDEHHPARKIDIILDENMKVVRMRHKPIRWGAIDYVRNDTKAEGKADIRLQIQSMRTVGDMNIEPFKTFSCSSSGILIPKTGSGEMPELVVHPKFRGKISFIRQKLMDSYKMSTDGSLKGYDHFTAQTIVDICRIKEYSQIDKKTGQAWSVDTFTDVTVVLPTVPPLHYRSEINTITKNILELGVKISNHIS